MKFHWQKKYNGAGNYCVKNRKLVNNLRIMEMRTKINPQRVQKKIFRPIIFVIYAKRTGTRHGFQNVRHKKQIWRCVPYNYPGESI